jgi:hypothetical protein
MLKRAFAISLLIVLITTSFSRLFVFAGFRANQKYIVTTLCENKNKPWMHCNGKCYLVKKLKQLEERQKNEDRQNQKNLFQETIIDPGIKTNFKPRLFAIISTPYIFRDFTSPESIIFQPPR